MASNRLSHQQVSQLGGDASARIAGHEGMSDRGAKGGDTTKALYGSEHYRRAAHKRWGRKVASVKEQLSSGSAAGLDELRSPSAVSAARGESGPRQEPE